MAGPGNFSIQCPGGTSRHGLPAARSTVLSTPGDSVGGSSAARDSGPGLPGAAGTATAVPEPGTGESGPRLARAGAGSDCLSGPTRTRSHVDRATEPWGPARAPAAGRRGGSTVTRRLGILTDSEGLRRICRIHWTEGLSLRLRVRRRL